MAEAQKPTKRVKPDKAAKPTSALDAEKKAEKERKAERAAHAAQVSKEAKAAKKAERAAAKEARAAEKAAEKAAQKAEQATAKEEAKAVEAEKKATKRSAAKDAGKATRPKAAESGVKAKRRELTPEEKERQERRAKKAHFDFSKEGRVAWASAHKTLLGTLAVIVFLILVLYPPICSYYAALRTNATLSGKLSDVNEQVDELSKDVSKLTSEEGLKDEARRLGYVEEGDTAVDMEGVEDTSSATSDATVMEESVEEETEDPWYIQALDFVFQYDEDTQGVS